VEETGIKDPPVRPNGYGRCGQVHREN
jgi:hypothetical protein